MRTLKFIILIGLLFTARFAYAQETSWLGGDGNWTDSNWDVDQPADGYDVVISEPGTVVYDDLNNYDYSSLLIDNQGYLDNYLGNDLTVAGANIVGSSGVGYLNHNGGKHTVGSVVFKPNDENLTNLLEQKIESITGVFLVGYDLGSDGTYASNNGDLRVFNDEIIGQYGLGHFVQNGGTNQAGVINRYHDANGNLCTELQGGLWLGFSSTGEGNYTLNNGILTVESREMVGYSGKGEFMQNGGNHTVGWELIVGSGSGSKGNFSLNDGELSVGSVVYKPNDLNPGYPAEQLIDSVSGNLVVGAEEGSIGAFEMSNGNLTVGSDEAIGSFGIGTFRQDGGSHTVSSSIKYHDEYGNFVTQTSSGLRLGDGLTGNGSYTLNNGILTVASQVLVGNLGKGKFIQNGGIFNNTADVLHIGAQSGGVGIYEMGGGVLNTDGIYIGEFGGTGKFNQTGGDVNGFVDGLSIRIARQNLSYGLYEISGGNLTAYSMDIGWDGIGRFIQKGGSAKILGSLRAGMYDTAVGTIDLEGGDLSVGQFLIVGDDAQGIANQIGGNNTIGYQLSLGYGASGKGRYNLIGGEINAGDERIGDSGNGTFHQTGGINQAWGIIVGGYKGSYGEYIQDGGNASAELMYVAEREGSLGNYNLRGGNLNVAGEYIGLAGEGMMNQSGGTNTVSSSLLLGWELTGNGTYNLNGGNLSVNQASVGGQGIGTFNQNNATHQAVNGIFIGSSTGGQGFYNLNGGNLSTSQSEFVGLQGVGTFTQNGATNNYIANSLRIAQWESSTGVYYLNNGFLTVDGNESVGRRSVGSLVQVNGTNSLKKSMYIGEESTATGTYELKGGNLNVGGFEYSGFNGTGTVIQTGGNHVVAQALYIAKNPGSIGAFELRGGKLDVSTVGSLGQGIVNNDSFNYSGGELNIYKGAFTNNGNFNLNGAGTRTVNGNVVNNAGGTIKVTDTTAVFTGTLTNAGAYQSDPSSNFFNDLVVTSTGYLTGGAGDSFNFHGGLFSESTNPLWNTGNATLSFVGSGAHTLLLSNANENSFRWGTLQLDLGAGLNFAGANGNLFVENLVVPNLNQLNDISGDLIINYRNILDPSGNPFDLTGWTAPSNLKAVPEPISATLFILGGAALGMKRFKKKP